jgi:hypothetical protein
MHSIFQYFQCTRDPLVVSWSGNQPDFVGWLDPIRCDRIRYRIDRPGKGWKKLFVTDIRGFLASVSLAKSSEKRRTANWCFIFLKSSFVTISWTYHTYELNICWEHVVKDWSFKKEKIFYWIILEFIEWKFDFLEY